MSGFTTNDRLNSLSGNALLKNSLGVYSSAGNIVTSAFFVGTVIGNITGNLSVPGLITQVLYNNSGNAGASAGFTFDSVSNTAVIAGNTTVGNLLTAGRVSATANVTGGNILTVGLISATANITGGNILTAGLISATANITGGNILTAGLISATANITGGNLLFASGIVSGTGNLFAANISGGNLLAAGLSLSSNVISNLNVTSNIAGGNILTPGLLSVTANVTGGNILTGGLISAGSTITGTSHLGSVVSVTANVTGGNILTGGLASITGNISVTGNVNRFGSLASVDITNGFVRAPSQPLVPRGMVNLGTGDISVPIANVVYNYYNGGPNSPTIHPSNRFLYICARGGTATPAGYGNVVVPYSINQSTGTLTIIGTPTATEITPAGVVCDPTGRFAYVINQGSNTVSQYSINQTTGVLTSITTAIACGTTPWSIAGDPTGRFVYVACYNSGSAGIVNMYSINQSTGALTSITTALNGTYSFYDVVCEPSGRFVYIATYPGVSTYSINQSTGALTYVSNIAPGGNSVLDLAVDPSGRFVFAKDSYSLAPTCFSFTIDQTTGSLTQNSSPSNPGSKGGGQAIIVDPTGNFLYTNGDSPSNGFSTFAINQVTGALTFVSNSSTGTSGAARAALDRTGRFIYYPDSGLVTIYWSAVNNLSAGIINASGTPIQIGFKSFGNTTAITAIQTYTACTGGTLAITSKIANSKFLVQFVAQGYASASGGLNIGMSRTISATTTRLVGVDGAAGDSWAGSANGAGTNSWTVVREYLDSPGQAAGTSITYNMLVASWSAGTISVNYAGYGITSTITITEIAP